MSTQVQINLDMCHPILQECIKRIHIEVISKHSMPFKIFETGRSHERQQHLLSKGRTHSPLSKHLYNMENYPPLYSVAVDYVFYNGKWSWNLRDQTIMSWYNTFGNSVLDICPELEWSGYNRKSVNYTHFQLRENIVAENFSTYPCIMHP